MAAYNTPLCHGRCGDEKTAHVGKSDTKPQLLRGGSSSKDSCSFPRRRTGKKRSCLSIQCHFQFGFYFIDFNNKVFQNTHRSWCRQHCHCYKHWQILSSINPYALMYQNKTKNKNHSSTGEGKSYSSSNSLEDSGITEVGSIVVYSRKKVFTAYILIISDAAEKLHLTAELKSRY